MLISLVAHHGSETLIRGGGTLMINIYCCLIIKMITDIIKIALTIKLEVGRSSMEMSYLTLTAGLWIAAMAVGIVFFLINLICNRRIARHLEEQV